jgi:protein involved in polysaccharide export with SLBB domain
MYTRRVNHYLRRLVGVPLLLTVALVLGTVEQSRSQQFSADDSLLIDPGYRYYDEPINPEQYLIRPGERLIVTFIGARLSAMGLELNPESQIVHPVLGKIDLAGKTLAEARLMMNEPLSQSYNAPSFHISVDDPFRIAVAISGEVGKPGLTKGFTSWRVSELIDAAGGVTSGGSTRQIRFIGGGREYSVDLDRVTFLGSNEFNPCLYSGHRLLVPEKSRNVIQVVGEVNNPREIELLSGDDLDLLVALAGGVNSRGELKEAFILGDDTRDPTIPGAIAAGDLIVIPRMKDQTLERVLLLGALKTPGSYPIHEGVTFNELAVEAGGVTSDGSINRIAVFRRMQTEIWNPGADTRIPITVSKDDQKRFLLEPGDSIVVPLKTGIVLVSGLVKRPGYAPYVDGKSARDYIMASGGFARLADREGITITDHVSGLSFEIAPDALVYDGDEIHVPARETIGD